MKFLHVIHRFYTVAGYSFEVRIESPTFRADLKRLSNLIDDNRMAEFQVAYLEACQRYGSNDTELIRLSSYARCVED